MNNILLVSEKTIKNSTYLSDNIGAGYLVQPIIYAQDLYIQRILGGKLYNRLLEGVRDDNLTENEILLLNDYIQPVLINQVLSEIIMEITFKIRNLGVVQTNDLNVTNVTMKDAQYLQQMYADKAAFYAKRLNEYLLTHRDLFSDYYPTCCPKDGMRTDSHSPYKCNVTL